MTDKNQFGNLWSQVDSENRLGGNQVIGCVGPADIHLGSKRQLNLGLTPLRAEIPWLSLDYFLFIARSTVRHAASCEVDVWRDIF